MLQEEKKYGPIKIRIICNAGSETGCQSSVGSELECDSEADEPSSIPNIVVRTEIEKEGSGTSDDDVLLEAKNKRAKLVREALQAANQSSLKDQVHAKEMAKIAKEYSELEKDNKVLQCKLDGTRRKLKSSQVLVKHYKKELSCKEIYKLKKCDGEISPSKDPMKYLCDSIEKLAATVLPRKHMHEKAALIINALSTERLFKGEGIKILDSLKISHIHNVFKEWRLLKAFDCSSVGAFKTSTLQAMHAVLDGEKLGYFPSASAIDRCRKLLDDHGRSLIGYERRETKYGEVYYMNFNRVIRLLLKATGLYEKAQQTNVSIAFTADGAALMKSRTHVSCGVKITDVDGFHPKTGLPLTQPPEGDDLGGTYFNFVQSRELCAILIMADAKDSKDLYRDVFKEFYDYSERLRLHGMEAEDGEPALKPFLVTHPQDMKSSQTVSNKGGNCKMKTYFCHLCNCSKHWLSAFKVGEERCNRCKNKEREKCYHHAVCDTISTLKFVEELEVMYSEYLEKYKKKFNEVAKQSKLLTDPLQINKESDVHHIDFEVPHNNPAKKNEFSQFIAKECLIRKIPTHGRNVENWREALRECVFVEKKIQFLVTVKEWHDSGRTEVPLMDIVELLIPCILHLENQVGEKLITMILRKGLNLFQGPATEYIKLLQDTIQRNVLGSENSPSHWRLNYTRSPDGAIEISPIQEHNSTIRCMMDSIDVIIERAFPEDENNTRHQLVVACSKYKEAIKFLTQHCILSNEEQLKFQDLIDDFIYIWIDLYSTEGMTNYLHLLASGHILYFLQKYKCLYIYSQQGWEHLNSTCTGYILHNSARGGKGSGENKGKSYIYPLIRYLIRDLLWKTGEADRFFIQWEAEKKIGSKLIN